MEVIIMDYETIEYIIVRAAGSFTTDLARRRALKGPAGSFWTLWRYRLSICISIWATCCFLLWGVIIPHSPMASRNAINIYSVDWARKCQCSIWTGQDFPVSATASVTQIAGVQWLIWGWYCQAAKERNPCRVTCMAEPFATTPKKITLFFQIIHSFPMLSLSFPGVQTRSCKIFL